MSSNKNLHSFFAITCFAILVFFQTNLSAQKLVFSEVYMDKENPENTYVEIYNPSDEKLQVKAFRLSNIRKLNILPSFNVGFGNNNLDPKQRIIFCSNKSEFLKKWGDRINVFEVPLLRNIGSSGFVGLRTRTTRNEFIDDGFLFGDPERVKEFKFCKGTIPIPFSSEGKSFTRNISKGQVIKEGEGFIKADPTPGK